MAGLVNLGETLLSIITKTIEACEQRRLNTSTLEDLQKFCKDLKVNIEQLQEKLALCNNRPNNSAQLALDAVQEDMKDAVREARRILRKGFVNSVWNANKIQSKIQALHERVMTSFQTRLSVVSLDVALESKHDQRAFQEAMVRVNEELREIFVSTSTSIKQGQQLALREELRKALQILTSAMDAQTHRFEMAVSMMHSVKPQTSDAEKFREDVLAALNGLSDIKVYEGEDGARRNANSSTSAVNWFEDPITWETMCDPVKATDGYTYDRWTILGKFVGGKLCGGLSKSPYTGDDDPRPFRIAADDLNVRSLLFLKFHDQEAEFRERRAEYRSAALHEVERQHFWDAEVMLKHVLDWDPHDCECMDKLEHVQRVIRGVENSAASDVSLSKLPAEEVPGQESQWKQLNPSRLVSAKSDVSCSLVSPSDDLSSSSCSSSGTMTSQATMADAAVPTYDEEIAGRPSRLAIPSSDVESLVDLSADGLRARFVARASKKVAALRANHDIAWQQDASQRFYFEVTIGDPVGKGSGCSIAIGFTHAKCYRKDKLPGLYFNSCGYHGADGNLFIGYRTVSQDFGPTFSSGNIIGAGIDYPSSTIFFLKNGREVGHTRWLRLYSSCTLCPVVGLSSLWGGEVHVNFGQAPFAFDASIQRPLNLDIVEQPARLLRLTSDSADSVFTSEDGLQAVYRKSARSRKELDELPIAVLMADRAICTSEDGYYFELTVCDRGIKGRIAIGFCRQDAFKHDEQPGWYGGSYGYHGDDGFLYAESGRGSKFGPKFSSRGTTVGAGINFKENNVYFVMNGRFIGRHQTGDLRNQPYSWCPIIGLHSTHERVRLNFGQSRFRFKA